MQTIVVTNNTLLFDEFEFKCSVGLNGVTKKKIEGDKKTPRGTYSIGSLYFRKDRIREITTKLKKVPITKKMGWCDDINSNYYNKLISLPNKIGHEKMFRKDHKYDLVIPINYNSKKIIKKRGSAIFIHLTSNYKKTLGCIAIKKKDLLILLKVINKKTKIKII